ncbi:MAG: hypothetical protein WBV73_02320, partial [Phormidium sp.]
KIDAVLTTGENHKKYFFKNEENTGIFVESSNLTTSINTKEKWGIIKNNFTDIGIVDAAFSNNNSLVLFSGNQYIRYTLSTEKGVMEFIDPGYPRTFALSDKDRIYKIFKYDYEIIRLTTSTAYKLNQKLLSGGIPSLLNLETQEIDDIPVFKFNNEVITPDEAATTIKVKPGKVKDDQLPLGNNLDFNSANSLYYWEIFFHAPFLIAQSLNTGQKFEEAKNWYEYIFDPTNCDRHWQFLPFQPLGDNIQAIIDNAKEQLDRVNESDRAGTVLATLDDIITWLTSRVGYLQRDLELSEVDEQYLDSREDLTEEKQALDDLATNINIDKAPLHQLLELIEKLSYRYKIRQSKEAQVQVYLDDPFDPHAIAGFRHIAYQKAIVMTYIDNLIDWGDMLFREYTRESINEARMLYILAAEILGKKPENLGTRILPEARSYAQLQPIDGQDIEGNPELKSLTDGDDDYDFLVYPEGTPNDSVLSPYFFVPGNELFLDYWNRVEDRLYKIRHCLNIMGISQPLPLFQPPIDPMALVQAVSSGAGIRAALASLNIPVPHYRFSFMVYKAKELVQKLNQFGNDLLGALEKKDAEELSMLQNRQEGVILAMTRSIKEAQLREAKETIKSLEVSLSEANNRVSHYDNLIDEGLTPTEEAQIGLMIAASIAQFTSSGLRIAAMFGSAAPDSLVGPFIMGVKYGGSNIGESLSAGAEVAENLGEGLSVTGEVLGIYANHERMVQYWQLQLKAAKSDVIQLTAQLEGAKLQENIAQREIEILEKEIEHNESIKTFMKGKFTNAQLYQWMVSKLSGMYFQTYNMAYEMAKSAEKAFQFERGMKESEVNFINGLYWDDQKKGLLAGESLGLDLDRMEKAYIETDSRGFEITKNISLLELDPIALLQLKNKGVCEFALTEALFDYDFPGHYCRQIKTLSLTFDAGEGQTVMATLTQLNHKTVLEPDPKAVKYLLDPKDQPPQSIRNGWKANQQIALSYVDQYKENNGLFELRFDDDRYLPFEGTGAVSTWRLELNGKKGSYNVQDILDVTINLKYTAEQGGAVFANAVKGMLKPYPTVRFFDMTYDFPEEWKEFLDDDSEELVLTFTRDLFPNMSSSQILGIYTQYELYEPGQVSMTLNYDDKLTLNHGKYLATNGLSISNKGSDWVFSLEGNKENLKNINLVIGYKAGVT